MHGQNYIKIVGIIRNLPRCW